MYMGGMECECMKRNVCMGVLAAFQTASDEKLGGTREQGYGCMVVFIFTVCMRAACTYLPCSPSYHVHEGSLYLSTLFT